MRKILLCSAVFACLVSGSAEAKRLPGPTVTFGPNCHALSRATGQSVLFVGSVLGGRTTRHRWGDGTMTDYRMFQGCFVSEETCRAWVGRHSVRHNRHPGYVRCTEVNVGLRP